MTVKKTELLYMACLLPFLLSQLVFTLTNTTFANVLLALKIVVFICFAVKYVLRHKINTFDLAVFIYFFVWLFAVLLNNGDLINYLKEVVVISSLIFIFEDAKQKDLKSFLNALTAILFIEFTMNLIFAIAMPNGLWKTVSAFGSEATYMFLGLGNQITPIFLLSVLTLLFQFEQKHFKFSFLYAIILFENIYFMSSATAIVGTVVMLLLFLSSQKFGKKQASKMALYIIILVGFLIIVLRVQYIFSFIIEDLLNKDLTLSYRTAIWDRAFDLIANSPIIGYGSGTLDTVIVDRHAHCYFLQIIIQSGFIGLICYINIFYRSLKSCWSNLKMQSTKALSACICGYLVCCITEVYAQGFLILILCMAFSADSIEKALTCDRLNKTEAEKF